MTQKRYWIGLAIIVCLAISFGNFTDLQFMNTGSDDANKLNTLTQEPLEVSKMINAVNNGTSANYSWTSWANASDNDKDLEADTLNVYYNFSDFIVEEYFQIDLLIEIYFVEYGSYFQIDYEWEEFYEYVEPGKSYLWNYEYYAPQNGNYSMDVVQIVWGEYNVTFEHQEEFSWINIHQFNLLQDYSVTTLITDEDLDSLNDTISFTYSLNFSISGDYFLEMTVTGDDQGNGYAVKHLLNNLSRLLSALVSFFRMSSVQTNTDHLSSLFGNANLGHLFGFVYNIPVDIHKRVWIFCGHFIENLHRNKRLM